MRPQDSLWSKLRNWLDPKSARPVPIMSRLLEQGASWSGKERDHFFLNLEGPEFVDLSGLAGLDSVADGRATAVLDYDGDGWSDLAVVNANAPQLLLHRNELAGRSGNRSLALEFVGGAAAGVAGGAAGGAAGATPGEGAWSNPDGIGVRVLATVGDRVLHRELRAGEGFASQSSKRLTIGLGPADRADALVVLWPSGREQRFDDVPAGHLLRVFEDPSRSPDGSGATRTPFVGPVGPAPGAGAGTTGVVGAGEAAPVLADLPRPTDSRLLLYTSLATWCVACAAEVDDLRRLGRHFGTDALTILGVPVDPREDRAQLDAWAARLGVEHQLLHGLSADQLADFEAVVVDTLKRPGLPATLITDREGRLLHAQFGPPSVSTVKRLLEELGAGG